MRQSQIIRKRLAQLKVVEGFVSALEGIASVEIAQIKDTVITSRQFFDELWQIYTQLRDDPEQAFVQEKQRVGTIFVLVTTDATLVGTANQRIVTKMLERYKAGTMDVMVLGNQGAMEMARRGIAIKHYFKLPQNLATEDISKISAAISSYATVRVFYQSYETLSHQVVKEVDLISVVKELATEEKAATEQVISSQGYLFEPSLKDVLHSMERMMMRLALEQIIMDAHLSELAARFNAMSAAKERAREKNEHLEILSHRATRAESDKHIQEAVANWEFSS